MNSKDNSIRHTPIISKQIGNKLADFEILSELGRGSFGVVFKVRSIIDSNIYVIKRMDLKHMKEKAQKEAWKEAMILKKLNHPNIIKYFVSFLEEEKLYIVMEYAEGGDLYSILKSYKKKGKLFCEEELWRFAYEILIGLNYLHSNNIIHRDIKCLNIFITKEKIIKIGDLGVSKIVANLDALICSRVGTPLYLSPELIKQQPYDFKVDLWALGCTLFHLATLEPPFTGDNLIVLGNNIVKTKQKALPNQFSTNFIKSVEGLLSKNPENRPSIKSLIELVPIYIKEDYQKKLKEVLPKMYEEVGYFKDYDKKNLKENVILTEKKISDDDRKNEEIKMASPLVNVRDDEKPNNYKRPGSSITLVKLNPIENSTSQAKNIPLIINEVKKDLNVDLNEVKNELPPANSEIQPPKYSNRASIIKEIISDQQSSRKPSCLLVKKDVSSPVKLNTNIISLKKDLESTKELDNNYKIKESLQSKNRVFSSRIRKSVDKKSNLRPNTASMNKQLVAINTKSDDFNTEVVKQLRPMTALEKVRIDDKNIINININFFNLDINHKFFEPKNTKSLLYINESIFKTEHDCPPIEESNKASNNKNNRITSGRVPNNQSLSQSIKQIYIGAVKISEYFLKNKEIDLKRTDCKDDNGKKDTKESRRNDMFNKFGKLNSTKNEFLFKSFLSKIESCQEKKKLTINDFK